MSEESIQIHDDLISGVLDVVVKNDARAEADMMLGLQYLAAVIGYIAASYPGPAAERDALLEHLAAFTKHVTDDRPFRFYDNRQKYLAFVNTCNEKWKVAQRATQELTHIRPSPPALRLFDAGVGDSTVLSHLMRAMHRRFPTIPFFIVGKEVSLEDVRLTLEKLPDRFIEHPSSVIIVTNLYYAEAPWLMPNDVAKASALNWIEMPLQGDSAHEFGEQLRGIDKELVDGWQVKANEKSGNPMYVRPSVLVMFFVG